MALAKQTLEELSQDPAAQRRARRRADQIALYEIERTMERTMEREAGFAEGEAKLLLKQLGLRFGPLSEATRVRVETASVEQLDAWAERVLTATTLEGVLAP